MLYDCPNCYGEGYMHDGAACFSSKGREIIKENSKCGVCDGIGMVNIERVTQKEVEEYRKRELEKSV